MSIEKNYNVVKDNTIKRLVNYNGDEKQMTLLDQRFYTRNKKHYPSVTYILSFIPKNKIFIDWLKEKGEDANIIVSKAAERGKQVHTAIERYLKGEEIFWITESGDALYSLEVWKMILKFADFWKQAKAKIIGSEIHVFSDKYEYAGTLDLIIEIDGELWIIDIKTSNTIPKVYHYQTAAYAQAWNENFDRPVTRRGLLWLKAPTKKEKEGKLQGKGWSLIESPKSQQIDFESFNLAYSMFKHEVDYTAPYSEIFPTSIKLKE